MERTNANEFRSNLKEWMEAARKEPIRITRKSGESFVLLDANTFEKMQLDLAKLQGITGGLMDVVQGRLQQSTVDSTTKILNKSKARALAGKTIKKAVG